MGHIIHMRGFPHRDTQELLPWYVTGHLDPKDLAAVEVHLANCAECREELEVERRLASAVTILPLDAEAGWSELRRRVMLAPPRQGIFQQAGSALRRALAWPGRFGWLLAGQVALALSVVVMILPRSNPAPYRTLGAAAMQPSGNVIVIFRPDTSEADLRRTLYASRARLVDGPTAAGAYLLQVPAAERISIIAALQTQPNVVLAQPVDAEARP